MASTLKNKTNRSSDTTGEDLRLCNQHSWSDLLEQDPELFENHGQRYLLITEVEQGCLDCSKLLQFVKYDDNKARVFRLWDGILVAAHKAASENIWKLTKQDFFGSNLYVTYKYVPPVYSQGIIIENFRKKSLDIRKLFTKALKSKLKIPIAGPIVKQYGSETSFLVLFNSSVDKSALTKALENCDANKGKWKIRDVCQSDCIRLSDLPDDTKADDVYEAFDQLYEITYVEMKGKAALVFFAHYEDAQRFSDECSKSKFEIKKKKVECALHYCYSGQPIQDEAGVPAASPKGDSSNPSLQPLPDSPKLKTNSQSQLEEGTFQFKPDVTYDVMDYLQQTPEYMMELSENLGVDLCMDKRLNSTIDSQSLFYTVKVDLKNRKKGKGLSRSDIEANLKRFFQRFSSKTKQLPFDQLEEMRMEFGWDNGDETLVQMEVVQGTMSQALIRWHDVQKGRVTVIGRKDEVEEVLKKIEEATYGTNSNQSEWNEQLDQPSTSYKSNYDQTSNVNIGSVLTFGSAFQSDETSDSIKVNPALMRWLMVFGKTEESCGNTLKSIEMEISEGGDELVLKSADSSAVARAKHLIMELAPQMMTQSHCLSSVDDIECLMSDKGRKLTEKLEKAERCAIYLQINSTSNAPATTTTLNKSTKSYSIPEETVIYSGQLRNSDVTVRVVKCDITDHHCDAIVNASNETLTLLSAGVSGSILRKGGPKIQQEMDLISKKKGRLIPGQAVTTGPGLLPCKKIIHAVGPRWSSSRRPVDDLRKCIDQVLMEAEENNLSSIAIPAISSGVFGGDVESCSSTIVSTVYHYLRNQKCCIKRVDFVEFADEYTMYCFKNDLMQFSVETPSNTPQATNTNPGPSSSIVPHPSPIVQQPLRSTKRASHAMIGSVNVFAKRGDITKENADAILNLTNVDFDLSSGRVSRAIVEAGGDGIIKELKTWRKFLDFSYRTTSGGRLPCNMIYHLPIPTDPRSWISQLESILCQAEKRKLKSIAFPAVGTGNLEKSVKFSASIIRKAIENFSKKSRSLREVRIVIFDEKIYNEFVDVLFSPVQLERIQKKVTGNSKLQKEGIEKSSKFAELQKPSRELSAVILCATPDKPLKLVWQKLQEKLEKAKLASQVVCDDRVKLPSPYKPDLLKTLFALEPVHNISIEISAKSDGTCIKVTGNKRDVQKSLPVISLQAQHIYQLLLFENKSSDLDKEKQLKADSSSRRHLQKEKFTQTEQPDGVDLPLKDQSSPRDDDRHSQRNPVYKVNTYQGGLNQKVMQKGSDLQCQDETEIPTLEARKKESTDRQQQHGIKKIEDKGARTSSSSSTEPEFHDAVEEVSTEETFSIQPVKTEIKPDAAKDRDKKFGKHSSDAENKPGDKKDQHSSEEKDLNKKVDSSCTQDEVPRDEIKLDENGHSDNEAEGSLHDDKNEKSGAMQNNKNSGKMQDSNTPDPDTNHNDSSDAKSSAISKATATQQGTAKKEKNANRPTPKPRTMKSSPDFTDDEWKDWKYLQTSQWRLEPAQEERANNKVHQMFSCLKKVQIVKIEVLKNPSLYQKVEPKKGFQWMFYAIRKPNEVDQICENGWNPENRPTLRSDLSLEVQGCVPTENEERQIFVARVNSLNDEYESFVIRNQTEAYPIFLVTFRM